jgi:hypothetical protein
VRMRYIVEVTAAGAGNQWALSSLRAAAPPATSTQALRALAKPPRWLPPRLPPRPHYVRRVPRLGSSLISRGPRRCLTACRHGVSYPTVTQSEGPV